MRGAHTMNQQKPAPAEIAKRLAASTRSVPPEVSHRMEEVSKKVAEGLHVATSGEVLSSRVGI